MRGQDGGTSAPKRSVFKMSKELPKVYEPQEVEGRVYKADRKSVV